MTTDQERFEQLLNTTVGSTTIGKEILRFCKRKFPEDYEDLYQQILYEAYKGFPGLRETAKFRGWIWSIARNKLRARIKKHVKTRVVSLEEVRWAQASNPEKVAMDQVSSVVDELEEKFDDKHKKYWLCLVLHDYHGLTIKKISEILEIPPSTVHYLVDEAKKIIRNDPDIDVSGV